MQSTGVPRWTARPASREVFSLGEGPVWDLGRERLLWVDVDAGSVHEGRLDGDEVTVVRTHQFEGTASAVVCSGGGDLLVAGPRTVGADAGTTRILPEGRDRRLNDGACDPAGAFVVGSMSLDGVLGTEVLARIEKDGTVTTLDDDLTLSNGLDWTADGSAFYNVDSVPGTVWIRPYDAATGAVGPRREWLSVTDALPDGLCVDAEDHVWIAMWGIGEVRRYTPDGVLAGVVDVPAPHTTSLAFIGDLMLITTATASLTPAQLAEYPDSGRLFFARTGVSGPPATPWTPHYSESDTSCA
jgi:sugar lactone lactonase YvrE